MSRKRSHTEKLLADLRHALLRLHKVLLDWERSGYERIHGRQSSSDLLKALLNDPQFAWLRPMSQLIVRIDEILDDNNTADAQRPRRGRLSSQGAHLPKRNRQYLRAAVRHGAAGAS